MSSPPPFPSNRSDSQSETNDANEQSLLDETFDGGMIEAAMADQANQAEEAAARLLELVEPEDGTGHRDHSAPIGIAFELQQEQEQAKLRFPSPTARTPAKTNGSLGDVMQDSPALNERSTVPLSSASGESWWLQRAQCESMSLLQ